MNSDVERMLLLAKKMKKKETGPYTSDYIPVIEILRDKNMTWQEIADFFRENGLEFSQMSLYSVWHKHERRLRKLEAEARLIALEFEELNYEGNVND